MFLALGTACLWADSSALLADSADNLGDAFVYAISLFVAYRSLRWRAGAAFVKGLVQLAFGLGIIIGIVIKLLGHHEPAGLAIMAVAAVALIANLICLMLLQRHRGEDVNMRSVWMCSRNDVIGNAAVIVAGGAVWLAGSSWPDLIVAALLALVFLHTSYDVLRGASRAWRTGARPS
ncbi:MAG: cation transporter [Gammaproteobacteria bacterium]|nr:cation transporter [Gammaproteobacteria bacterium]